MLFVHHQYAVVLSFLKYNLLVVLKQEKLVLKNRSQQVNQKKTPVLLGVLEVWGYILISRPNSKKKAFYTKPTPNFKSSDALKLFWDFKHLCLKMI